MQINPGGRLDTKDIIGRDNEIDRYWHILKRQGLVLSAERRIGKTHILFKMREEYQAGYVPFYQDLEAVHSVAELIRSIYATVENSSGAMPKVKAYIAKRSTLLPKRIGGIDLPTADGTWQTLLADVFDILIRSADDNTRILMLWDEFPLMLHNLQRNAGPDTPIQLLDHLRALRIARADRLRFLFTGSVGLHLVLRSLREAGSTNDPVNDMLSLTVPPIARHHTCGLAEALLRETRAAPLEIPSLASAIADHVGGFPYYVHHVVDQLDQLRRKPTLEDVSAAVDHLVYDPHDPANLKYYLTRLSSYYAEDQRRLALLLLDTLARQPSGTRLPQLLNLCKHGNPLLANEQLLEVLTILAEDHYIERRNCGSGFAYDFRWPLVKKWWKETRP
ncbi:MAG: hypothetical protein OXN89_26180 [Bryobacterales bacterium]|nr:hypothetical protein [Bryobacterales bacterium]